MGFQRGTFPATFLGVPLITSRLSLADCYPLLEKIKSRLSSWTTKSLSYAGRLILLKSILFAMQAYWATHFFLPSAILKEIQRYMRTFLWKGSIVAHSGARVAWETASLPVQEGGLGLKSLRAWNTALLVKQLLKVINWHDCSLWASWVRQFLLRKKHFWTTHIPVDCAWIWRKILQLRPVILPFLRYKIGSGAHTSLWFDPWLGSRPLAHSPGHPLVRHSGLPVDATVSCLLRSNTWTLPTSNHVEVIDFRMGFDYATPFDLQVEDQILWDGQPLASTRVTTIWHALRVTKPVVNWAALVWNSTTPPRWSFIAWLLHNSALSTKDRLLHFGISLDPECYLCHRHPETLGHLFFECSYSYQILAGILRRCGWRGQNRNWSELSTSILSFSHSSRKFKRLSFCFVMVIYYLWRERNSRMHAGTPLPARILVRNLHNLMLCRHPM